MSDHEPVTVVTGGSLGIGADVCARLLEQGGRVVNLSNQPAAMKHAGLITIDVDLTDRNVTAEIAQQLAREHAVTRFVHCAGAVRPALLQDVKLDDLDYLTELHLNSAIVLTQAFLPAMRAANFGRIVLISTRGVLGLPTRTAYASTKAAMLALVRTWALELAQYGITANSVAPGPIDTDLFQRFVPDPQRRAEIAAAVPVRRLGTPADIGRVVQFLLDAHSSFITGQTWFICGGASVGSLTM